jgi:hypothetical protein
MASLMRTIAPFALAMALTAILAGCDNKSVGGNASPTPPPVTVSQPLEKMITEWDEYTGRFTAVETVEICARVSGFIESVHFKEGQIVKKGDLLFVIDPRPFGIAVEQAKADLERARAKLEIATHDVDRGTPLARNATITERELDTRKSVQRDAAGGVGAAEAALRQAELNLEWAAVRAPISGASPTGGWTPVTSSWADRPAQRCSRRLCLSIPFNSCSTPARPISSAICDWRRLEPGLRRATSKTLSPCGWPTRVTSRTRAHGFRRQCGQSEDRHHARPRRVRQ